jgi:hypothetical protein
VEVLLVDRGEQLISSLYLLNKKPACFEFDAADIASLILNPARYLIN